jgi:hypothetical protein
MASANLEILIAARNQADAELQKLNRALRDAGSTSKVTATNAGELMKQLRGAEQAQREIAKLDRYIAQLGDSADQSKGKMGGLMAGLGSVSVGGVNVAGLATASGAALAAGAALNFAKDKMGEAMDNASALNETMSKSAVVFGASASAIEKFGNSAAGALGMSKQQAVEAAASVGNLFLSTGLSQQEAAKLSRNIVQLASDLSSFNNIPIDESLQKLRSGLVGEAEPLRSVGVLLSEVAVSTKAMEMGFVAANGTFTEAQKVQARYALILEQTKTAQGDFARTADGAANSQRTLDARTADLSARLGAMTLPIRTGVITALNDLLKSQDDMRESQRRASEMIAAGVPKAQAYAQAAREVGRGLDDAAVAADRAERGIRGVNSAMSEFLDEAPIDISGLAAKAAAASDLADSFNRAGVVNTPTLNRMFTPNEQAEASDLADSFNRVNSAAGLMANTENKLQKQREDQTASTKAATDAEREHAKAIQDSMQRATSAVQGLQSALNDLNRTPLLGQGAFDKEQAKLQDRIAEIDLAQKQMAGQRGSRTELRTLAKERIDLEKKLAVSQAEEIVKLGPQQRTLQQTLNPSLPEMSLHEILTRAAGAKAGLAAAQSYQQTFQENNVTINIDASGRVSAIGGDPALMQALGEAVEETVDRKLAEWVADAERSPQTASPYKAGAR